MSKPENPTGLHYSGPNNSQLFTNCCGTAIGEFSEACPKCERLLAEGARHRAMEWPAL